MKILLTYYRSLVFVLMLITTTAGAQIISISGPASVNIGETHTYSITLGSISPESVTWTAFGGVVETQGTVAADIRWTEVTDDNKVTCFIQDAFGQSYLGVLTVDVAVPVPNTTFSITYGCNSTTVTRNSDPEADYDWFWQTSDVGTSTALGSGASITIGADGPLYLRSRSKNVTDKWSVAQHAGTIDIIENPEAGTIGGSAAICPGQAAPGLTSLSSATGDALTLQWQHSADASNWSDVPSNGNQPTYTPGNVSVTTHYRRLAFNSCSTVSTNTVTISMKPVPQASALPATQQVCSGQSTAPVAISNTNNVAGTGFTWSIAAPNISGVSTPSGTGSTIPAQTLSVTASANQTATYAITPHADGCTGSAVSVTVTVYGLVTSGSISGTQTLCSGTAPATLGSTAGAQAGNGVYSYQWEQSINEGASWTNAPGTGTSITYAPTVLTTTTMFRRRASSCGASATTLAVTLTVNPQTVGGTVGPGIEAYGESSGTLTLSGHTGAVQQWQKKVGAGSWSNVSNTTTSLAYSNITQTTYYRAEVKSGVCSAATSSEVSVVIYSIPAIAAPAGNRVVPGGSITISSSPGYYAYRWYKNDAVLTGENLPSLQARSPGEYKAGVRATATSPEYITGKVVVEDGIVSEASDMNYTIATSFLKEGVTESTDLYDLHPRDLTQHITYFDDHGRPIQSIGIGSSPLGKDVVQHVAYDEFGREVMKYLPYASDTRKGEYVPAALAAQADFYNQGGKVPGDNAAFAVTVFENSPLSRVMKQGSAGQVWQPDGSDYHTGNDRTIKKAYEYNQANEVLLWTYTPDAASASGPVNARNGSDLVYYLPNELFKNRTRDEHSNEVIEYVDKKGRTILKKVQTGATEYACTYYLYDDLGNLVVVLPPEAVKKMEALIDQH